MAHHFKKTKIVPDVVDKGPTKAIQIIYGTKTVVTPGSILRPTDVKNEPILSWDADLKSFHTLCMIDPDFPCKGNPQHREFVHWLIVNIPGCRTSAGMFKIAYVGAAPPKGTGMHRYVFLVYKQPKQIDFAQMLPIDRKTVKGRLGFSIRNFANEHKFGDLIAGNYFLAQWDDYVSILFNEIGIKMKSK